MSVDPWHTFLFSVLPAVLVTATVVVLLGVLIARRHRLGTAAMPAIAGFALLAAAIMAGRRS